MFFTMFFFFFEHVDLRTCIAASFNALSLFRALQCNYVVFLGG